MPKILLLTRYGRLGASSRIRFLKLIPDLQRVGLEVDVQPLLDDKYVRALYGAERVNAFSILSAYLRRLAALVRRRRYDLLWVEKEALPWVPAWLELGFLKGVPLVVDLDDIWGQRYAGHSSALVQSLLRNKIDSVLRQATLVIAGNEYLGEHARRIGARRVEIVPSTIDLATYPSPPVTPSAELGRPAVIGWIGTPLNTHYLSLVEPALRALSRTVPVKLHVVGGNVSSDFSGIPVENFEWSESTEVDRVRAFDVGIMPLRDAVWERGKSAYKLLQVMAAGVPVVASPVGANCHVVRDGINGYLASSTEEWVEALRMLCTDPSENRRMGREARKTVEDGYTLKAASARLTELLGALTRRPE